MTGDAGQNLHATCVSVDGVAVLIIGPSGSGKSSLALELIGLGAELIADDVTRVVTEGGEPMAMAPDRLQGVIEARGVGLIRVPWRTSAPVRLVVYMGEDELERLPNSPQFTKVLNFDVASYRRVKAPYFASAILNVLRYGRVNTA